MEKRFVVVALVVVEFVAVKFWRVVDPATDRFPAESNVEVAVPPKYAVPTLERMVVEALENFWRAVHVLGLARLRVAVRMPPSVAGVPPIVRVEFESERAIVLAERRLVPIVVVATTLPLLSVPRRDEVRLVNQTVEVAVN